MLLRSRCTPCKRIITCSVSIPPIRHKFRRASPVLKEAQSEDGQATQTLQRFSYLLSQDVPDAAMGNFNRTMSCNTVKTPERAHVFEAVLDLLLRENNSVLAANIFEKMEKEGMQLNPAVRAKMSATRFAKGLVTLEVFLDNLRELFSESSTNIGEWHFREILSQVFEIDGCTENCERILQMYLETKGPDYRLDPLLVTFIIELHLRVGNQNDAQRWLDHHSSRPPSVDPQPTMLYPYTTFISRLTRSISSKEDPKRLYGPVLQQITDAGLNADTPFVNTLIAMELRSGRTSMATEFYIALQKTLSFDIYPDAVTFAQLFTASGRAAIDALRTQYTNSKDCAKPLQPLPISSRALFRDMLSLHALQTAGELAKPPERAPVLTTSSLGQALWQFTAAQDYAAACVVLRMYITQRIPVEEQAVVGSVTTALLERCRREIRLSQDDAGRNRGNAESSSEGSAWVTTFLNLRSLAPWRLKSELPRETERRMVDAAKRDLMLNALSTAAKRAEKDVAIGGDTPERSGMRQGLDELDFRRRIRRLRLVDAMLTRALAASFVDGWRSATPAELRKAAEQAIVHATEEMVPIDNPSSAGIDPEGPENKDTVLKEDSSDENGYYIQQSSIESNIISKESEASK